MTDATTVSEPTAPTKRYLRASVLTGYLNLAGSSLAVLLLLPVIVGKLGFADYGRWASIFIPIGAASVLDFGLPKAIVVLRGQVGSLEEYARLLGAGLRASVGVAMTLVGLAGAAAAIPTVRSAMLPASLTSVAHFVILGGGVAAAAQLLTNFYRAQLEAAYHLPIVNGGFLLLTVGNYGLVALAVVLDASVEGLIVCTASVYVSILILHMVIVEWRLSPSYLPPGEGEVGGLARTIYRAMG